MLSNLAPDTFPASIGVAPRSAPIPAGFEPLQWESALPGEEPRLFRDRLEFRRNLAARVVVDVLRSCIRRSTLDADASFLGSLIADYDADDILFRATLGLPANE